MPRRPDDPARWWLAAQGPEELTARLDEHADTLPDDDSAADHDIYEGDGPARLGIVAPTRRKVRLAQRLLAKGAPWRGRSDIWFTPARPTGKVAFLFPGVEPVFGADEVDLPSLADRLGLEAPPVDDSTVAHRSASIYRLGIFLDQVLHSLGAAPDVVAGHSIGEWSGTVAAGVLPRDHAADLLSDADLEGIRFPDVDFGAVAAGADAVTEAVHDIDGIHISHDNCPRQSVLCGPPDQVALALERLQAQGMLGYKLPFQSGFHTPVIAPLVEIMRQGLENLPFGPGDVPLWSATTVAPYPTTAPEIVDLHMRHLVEPVRFGPLIQRLYHDVGVRTFVQVGIGSLTGFVDDALDGHDHASIPALTAKRSALAQMHRAVTALWVEGVGVGPSALRAPGDAPLSSFSTSSTAAALRAPGDAPSAPVPSADRPTAAAPATADELPGPPPGPSAVPPGDATTLRATAGLLAAAARNARDVTDLLAPHLTPATAPTPGPTDAPGTGATPLVPPSPAASTGRPWPTDTQTVVLPLSLATRPETLDHRLFEQPDGWPDPGDGFPIVAMTTQIQMLQDLAEEYGAGRDVTEVFGVRNVRWLDLSDPQEVEATVTADGDDVLTIALGSFCRANLRLGRFPAAPTTDLAPLRSPHPASHTAEELFDRNLMFHGPRFQGITTLGPVGDNGISGQFHHLDTPGSLLDNLGKLIAYWVMERRGLGEAALPIGIDRVEFFGPEPAPGTDIHCDVRILELQENSVRADGTLALADGTIWCRVHNWSSIVFLRDEVMAPVYLDTSRSSAAEPQRGGWTVVIERWPTGPGRELTARRYMTRDERRAFDHMNLLQQRRRVIDTVAAKDTVRRWLWDTYGIPSYPVQVGLVPDGERHYRVDCPLVPAHHDLRLTLSSLDWLAVTVLGDGAYRDIEARVVPDDTDGAAVAADLADELATRHPGHRVHHFGPVDTVRPSSIDFVRPPTFAVAWTDDPASPDDASGTGRSEATGAAVRGTV